MLGCFDVAALRNPPEQEKEGGQGDGEVQEEHPAPGGMVDQPTAEHGTKGSRHRTEAGPGSDGPPSFLRGKRGRDDGEAAGHDQRRAGPLKSTGHDERPNAPGKATERGSGREENNADRVHSTPPEAISQ